MSTSPGRRGPGERGGGGGGLAGELDQGGGLGTESESASGPGVQSRRVRAASSETQAQRGALTILSNKLLTAAAAAGRPPCLAGPHKCDSSDSPVR